MDQKLYEETLKNDISIIFEEIINDTDGYLPIQAIGRVGAAISDYLEDKFVEYNTLYKHNRIYDAKSAPKSDTKSPYDICWNYKYLSEEGTIFDDLIWGDIKATKVSFKDSNPDLGTPKKMMKFMLDGHFHMLYVLFKYEETADKTVKLLKHSDGKYARLVLLKDIHHSVRINPKPQFQVNISEEAEYRTKKEWIDLFELKYNESIDRSLERLQKEKKIIQKKFEKIREIHSEE